MRKALEQTNKNQQGIVLAISLIMLLLITILAISGMRATIMEERMASNSRNTNLAFQRAETALRAGEAALEVAANGAPTAKSKANGQANNIGIANPNNCVVSLDSLDFHLAATWAGGSCTQDNGSTLDTNKHKYFIEYFYGIAPLAAGGISLGPCYYRVTARGYGDNQNSYSTLQSTYKFTGCVL